MESSENKEAYIKTLKLALATSIIRSKPSNVTSKQYAQQLASTLKRKESTWKLKVTALEDTLRQKENEITLLKLKNGSYQNCGVEEEEGVHNMNESQGPIILKCQQYNELLGAVVSFKKWYQIVSNDDTVLENVKINLTKALENFNVCLNGMSTNQHNISMLEQNVTPLSELLKKDKFSSDKKVFSCCVNTVKNVIRLIMISDEFENSLLERLEEMVLLFSRSCVVIREVVIDNLVIVISGYTELLRGTYSEKLDANLLDIADTFPMYSHKVWVISSLMTEAYSQQQKDIFPLWKSENKIGEQRS